jgi:predicted NBD/HSP70 family sugar kinase
MQIPPKAPPDLGPDRPLACVEVGGGGIQTVLFDNGSEPRLVEGAQQPDGYALAFAVPGIIANGVVRLASNLGWRDIDPVEAFKLEGPADLVVNDAEAAALGEAALRGERGLKRLVYLCIGTGVGGAVVSNGEVIRANLFGHNARGHGHEFGKLPCRCERRGCLETVAAGWALPDPLSDQDIAAVGRRLAMAIGQHELCSRGTVVIGGGIARRYPALLERIASHLPSRDVERSLAPPEAKSAAAWGLWHALAATGQSARESAREAKG